MRELIDRLWHQKLGRPYRLSYATSGAGDRSLLLLHGLASSNKIWLPLVRQVHRDWEIIAPDLLGFGQSPVPEWNSYDIDQHTKHVLALLRRFRVKGPIVIVAHSMGCLIATHIASMRPDMVKRLILLQPPLFADVPDYKAHQRAKERYFDIFRYIGTHPQLLFKDGELRKIWVRLKAVSMREDMWIAFQRSLKNAIMNQSAYDELHVIRVPTTIVHGRLDVVVPRADVRKMLQDNPCIDFRVVTSMHGVSARVAKVLATLLNEEIDKGPSVGRPASQQKEPVA